MIVYISLVADWLFFQRITQKPIILFLIGSVENLSVQINLLTYLLYYLVLDPNYISIVLILPLLVLICLIACHRYFSSYNSNYNLLFE